MTRLIDAARPNRGRTRRDALGLFGAGAVMLGIGTTSGPVFSEGDDETVLTEALVLRDPDIPVAGNANGDITIVEYFDFNCPYCRKLEPELRQVVQDDGKVRLVLKEWPILGPVSAAAGIDVDRAARDLETNAKAIDAILARNNAQATAFEFKGTPSFIVGKFRV